MKKNYIAIALSSAGRRVELLNIFRDAARELGYGLKIIGLDAAPEWSPACQISDAAFRVPRVSDPAYIPEVMDICHRHDVQLLVPTIDTELMVYAENKASMKDAGVDVLVSDKEAVAVARNKLETARLLEANGIETPRTVSGRILAAGEADLAYPLVLKPSDGSCSNGVFIAATREDVENAVFDPDRYIAQELCRGDEYTINAFYTRSGECVACVPHYRKFVRGGEVCFAETVRVQAFTDIAHRLPSFLKGMWGPICFQGFLDETGGASIFEINARFGGGYPICDKAGGAYAKWIIQEIIGQIPVYHDNWREGLRMLRYDAAIFTGPSK